MEKMSVENKTSPSLIKEDKGVVSWRTKRVLFVLMVTEAPFIQRPEDNVFSATQQSHLDHNWVQHQENTEVPSQTG